MTTYKQRDTTMQTYKAVARARHYCDVVRDHCKQVTKQKQNTLHGSQTSKNKIK